LYKIVIVTIFVIVLFVGIIVGIINIDGTDFVIDIGYVVICVVAYRAIAFFKVVIALKGERFAVTIYVIVRVSFVEMINFDGTVFVIDVGYVVVCVVAAIEIAFFKITACNSKRIAIIIYVLYNKVIVIGQVVGVIGENAMGGIEGHVGKDGCVVIVIGVIHHFLQ